MTERDDLIRLASANSFADINLRWALITARLNSGMTVEQMAEKIGWERADVRYFESMDNDPTLSEIRTYALALGLRISHTVESAQ